MELCRKRGWVPAVVEKWNPHVKRRQDLYGFLDLVVMDDQPGLLGVQATGGRGDVASHVAKLAGIPAVAEWLGRGLRLEIWSWRQLAAYRKDGTRAKRDRWAVRILRARLEAGALLWDEIESVVGGDSAVVKAAVLGTPPAAGANGQSKEDA